MDEDLNEAFEGIVEAIRDLQAGQIANTRLLRAIISSHPDPAALREQWNRFSSTSAADVEMQIAADPARRKTREALVRALKDWSERLDQDLRRP